MVITLSSYPSIYNLGHKAVQGIFNNPVLVEEKIDGSQFSFGKDLDGNLHIRSKGAVIQPDQPPTMFRKGVNTVLALAERLLLGYTYRGEYLEKPKHNALAYSRIPVGHVILFDINDGLESYLSPEAKQAEAERLGLEVVPWFAHGKLNHDQLIAFMNTDSVLGGQKIEGVVVKPLNYDWYGIDKKVLMGKYVSEGFKEKHDKAWKLSNPSRADILTAIGASYGNEARWRKAIQHLREQELIEDAPQDIGKLFKEVNLDVLKEAKEEIKDSLFEWAWPQISRRLCAGLPQWYKDELLKKSFDGVTIEEGIKHEIDLLK